MSNDPRPQAAVAAGTRISEMGGLIAPAGATARAALLGQSSGPRFTTDPHKIFYWNSVRKFCLETLESYLNELNLKENSGMVQGSTESVQNFQTDSGQNVARDNVDRDDDTQEFGQLRSNQHPRTRMRRERRFEYDVEQEIRRYMHEHPENFIEPASGGHGQDIQASSPQYPPTNMGQSSYDTAQGSQHVATQRYTFGTICESPINFEGPSFANFQQHTLGNYADSVGSSPHLRRRPSNDPAAPVRK